MSDQLPPRQIVNGSITEFKYTFKKVTSDGKTIDSFVKPSYLTKFIPAADTDSQGNVVYNELYIKSFRLDNDCFRDHAAILIPRSIDYSAALIDYFFRGEIDMVSDDDSVTGYKIINLSKDEEAEGKFALYYDDTDDKRTLITEWNFKLGKKDSGTDKSSNITFTVPESAKKPGTYILVFRGTLGAEKDDAVVGKVVHLLPPVLVYGEDPECPPKDKNKYSMKAVKSSGFGIQTDADSVQSPAPFDCHLPSWSKTHDKVTITAYEFGTISSPQWAVAATYKGVPAKIDGNPNGPGFAARITVNGNVITLHKGFDVWKEGDDYYIGTCSDVEAAMYVYKLDKKESDFKLIGTHPSQKKNYVTAASGDDVVRLTGYGMRKTVWCAYGLTPTYWTEDFAENGYSAKNTDMGEGVTGVIRNGLWNPIERKEYMYFVPNVVKTQLPNKVTARFIEAHNYYTHPLYCTVYQDGHYEGPACKDKKFIGTRKVRTVSSGPFGQFELEVYEPFLACTTTNKVIKPRSVTNDDYGVIRIGSGDNSTIPLNQGANATTVGGSIIYDNLDFVPFSYSDGYNWCEPGAKITELSKWQFDISGIAIKTKTNRFVGKQFGTVSFQQQACVRETDENGNYKWTDDLPIGDEDISGHDDWKAVLLHGTDSSGLEINPIIVYNNGLIKTSSGQKISDNDVNRTRVFFQNP